MYKRQEEALHRLVEIYFRIGLIDESKKYASLLGYNYQSGDWYEHSYRVFNKNYKKGMSSSIKTGIKRLSKKNKGFIIVQSDMPFIKTKHINKICNSILKKKQLVHALKFRKRVGNPIGFDISVLSKFKKIKSKEGKGY